MPLERKIIDFKLTCNKCGEMKSPDGFYNQADRITGKNAWCKICVQAKNRNRYEHLPDNHPLIVTGSRTCCVCKEQKSLDFFGKTKEGKFGRSYKCKSCKVKLETGPSRIYNPNRPKKSPISIYGITEEDKIAILSSQMGLCANRGCGKSISLKRKAKNRACVDHDHSTGKVRSLLCHCCNVALGFLGEDKNRIFGLTEYLQKHT